MRRVPTSDADGPGNLNAVADAIRVSVERWPS